MTPDLMDAGAERLQARTLRATPGRTESGDRSASYSRIAQTG